MHNKKVDLKDSEGVTAVLDEQQRLTSIYLGLNGTYTYKLKYMARKNENAYPLKKLCFNLLSSPDDSNKEVRNNQNKY